jgi:hypothetical protein
MQQLSAHMLPAGTCETLTAVLPVGKVADFDDFADLR